VLSSADHSVTPPAIHIPRVYNAAYDLIERNLRAGREGKVAYIDDAGSYTYGDLARRVNQLANAVNGLGIHMEQRVLLCLQDSIDFPTVFLGAIKAGVIPVAVNPMLTPGDFAYMLEDSRACAIVVSAALLPVIEPLVASARFLKHVIVSGGEDHRHLSLHRLLQQAAPDFDPAPTTCDDVCFWLYSSGSTGSPKGTLHIHANLIHTAELYGKPIAGYREDDLVLSVSKLPFAYGLGNSLTFPLAVGATAILIGERPTPAAVIKRLRKHRPTVVCSIPTAYAALLAHPDLPVREEMRLRLCISAGEALPADVGLRWQRHFGVDILDGIGSTEMLHIYLSNRPGEVQYGTTGRAVPGYEARIVDDDGKPLPPGSSGELHVRGPTRALLYWNNHARSTSTFVGEWMRTGDKYRQREDGCFVYEGRNDDMLKVGGLYVSPAEVEAVLIAHEAVLETAVVGRQDRDGLVKPCAYIVLKDGRSVSAEELQQHVKSRLAPYKYPRWIEFLSELPKTVTGKVQRFKLRQLAETK
jgi:benzoate-CoA ligase